LKRIQLQGKISFQEGDVERRNHFILEFINGEPGVCDTTKRFSQYTHFGEKTTIMISCSSLSPSIQCYNEIKTQKSNDHMK
jgi:hypothetical protein